ncbi:diaminopimelate epimerase [Salegentibacter sp. BDJ18]|jgi:diaminopimelate epimerase|uniref:diaminopimelate epimerase n=1 Tax=Salegentibacter sp. BDJ18 TaxID=2816376 RepID=UPI001AAF70C0|nr:diaminopimelate epimerase [Salegentibacter sp. BDJ18]MBO2545906.1 diaminopimelate epimerase [Salegentibacter sp. BDJ18]
MKIPFYKYQGTGNDFVMIDNRQQLLSKNNTRIIKKLCDRKFGIGGDGLILLENPEVEGDDFKMVYFNADGNESSMCGNGGRCLVAFAKFLGIIQNEATFTAIDGLHKATISNHLVSLQMQNVLDIKQLGNSAFLDTGSPHHVIFTKNVAGLDVKKEGAVIRYSDEYVANGGTNVNFVDMQEDNTFLVRTYERGVEDETLSCGTGVTAVALAAHASGKANTNTVKLIVPGGELSVSFKKENETYTNVWLTGPAEQVFKGEIVCQA